MNFLMASIDQAGAALGEGTIVPYIAVQTLDHFGFPGIPVDDHTGHLIGEAPPPLPTPDPCPDPCPEPLPDPIIQNDVLSMTAGDAVVDAVAQDVVADTALLLLAA